MQLRRLIVPALVPAAFFAGTAVNIGLSQPQATQQPAPTIVEIDYMKVPANFDEAEYVKLEREVWKPIHQERIKQGMLRSWALYGVRFPQGSAREYDYVTVNTYNALPDIDRGFSEELIKKAVPRMPIAEIAQKTGASRSLVRGDLLYLVDKTP